MTTRNEILARLKANARDVPHPPAWRSRRHFGDLVARFTESLTASKGEMHHASDLETTLNHLESVFQDINPRCVVANDEPPLNTINLPGHFPAIDWHIVGKSPGSNREICQTADVGLSGADAALAETGTIVITSGPGKSRLTTLLPPIHIALVPTSYLTTDIFTWTSTRRKDPRWNTSASITLISGPSKTADIEQTLAVGIHGPKRLIVILYDA